MSLTRRMGVGVGSGEAPTLTHVCKNDSDSDFQIIFLCFVASVSMETSRSGLQCGLSGLSAPHKHRASSQTPFYLLL